MRSDCDDTAETKKATASVVALSISHAVEGTIWYVIQLEYSSSKAGTRATIIHLIGEALMEVAKQDGLDILLVFNVHELAESEDFINAHFQHIARRKDFVNPGVELLMHHIHSNNDL